MHTPLRRLSLLALLAVSTLFSPLGLAGTADIANVPLGTTTARAKPNIMFILDDSGSMNSEYMPDDSSDGNSYGYYSSQCNGLWFDPANSYEPPTKIASDGSVTSYPNASFTAAWNDGFNSSWSGTTNLDGWGYYQYSGTQPRLNWTYNTSGTLIANTFVNECRTKTWNVAPFAWVSVNSASATELKQKYANWYAYYRKRLYMARTAIGHAFKELDANYRVGFTMISDPNVSGSNFLDVADFTTGSGGQRSQFYDKLYGSYSGSWTPLRGALSKVGKYYAMAASGQSYDPIQYSCQRNYAILSTDGYWNTNIETSSYGPYKTDGSTVEQQDGNEARPMHDGAGAVTVRTTTDPLITTTTVVTPVTTTRSGYQYEVASSTGNGCSWKYKTRYRNASCSITWDRTAVTTRTETTITEVRITNGVAGSPTTRTTVTNPTVTTPSSAPNCPDGDWSGSGSWSETCYSTWELSSYWGVSPGMQGYLTTATGNTNGTPSTTTATSDPPATTTETETTTGGALNTLADVAEYYWKTDLRTSLTNNVASIAADPATYQHMNTFTVGLGVNGNLAYDPNYLTQTSGDYVALKNGTKTWPVPNNGSDDARKIDDLWHAAVNGRGQYFSAGDPAALSTAISTTLARITEQVGSGAAAAASTLTPTTGDDWIFLPSYAYNPDNSVPWHGDLRAFQFVIDPDTKAISTPDTSAGSEVWSAKTKLDARTTERVIYFKNGTTSLAEFTYANLTTAGLNGSFDNRCTTASPVLSQCATMATTPKAKVTGTNLVNFLRGDTSLYLNVTDANNRVFRTRASRLGDFINASPVYVGKPPFKYADAGYATFVSTNASRTKVVYAGGNDGMLHAFKVGTGSSDTTGGTELWAFIPTAVIPNLWRLADANYDTDHRYFVDATPVVADVYKSGTWRTILVGGLGAGGRSYYALDITDPANPSLLWEINQSTTGFGNLGLSYGNPVITKNKAGTWVVAFSSGVNNVSSGDGVGRLYVVDAVSGSLISTVSTGAGSTATPSNLMRIDGWVESVTDNTSTRIYGGDMLGNLWRFDHDDLILPAGAEAFRLGTAEYSGTPQPITSKPLLTELSSNGVKYPVIAFGTGRYLGLTDLSNTTVQSIYAVKDTLGTTSLGTLRDSAANLVQQSLNSSRQITSPAAVNWASKNGWFIDLNQSSGERIFLDGVPLVAGTLAFASAVPDSTVCTPGGTSYLYLLNLGEGTVSTVHRYNTLIVGLGRVLDSAGEVSAVVTLQTQALEKASAGSTSSSTAASVRRASWRELID